MSNSTKMCNECGMIEAVNNSDYCHLCKPYMNEHVSKLGGTMKRVIRDVLRMRRPKVNIIAEEERLMKAYAEYESELSGMTELDMKALKEKDRIGREEQETVGFDCWGRAIPASNKGRKGGYSVSMEGKTEYSRLGRTADGSMTGVFEDAYKLSMAGIQTGTLDLAPRNSYYEDGLIPGYVHFIDSVGLDHGTVRNGAERRIERAEKDKAITEAVESKEWREERDKKQEEFAVENKVRVLAVFEEAIEGVKDSLREKNAEMRADYISNQAMAEVCKILKGNFGSSYVFVKADRKSTWSKMMKDLWAFHKSLRLKDSFDKVNAVVEDAFNATRSDDLALKIVSMALNEECQAVEIWSALKYARENDRKYEYPTYRVIREVANDKRTA